MNNIFNIGILLIINLQINNNYCIFNTNHQLVKEIKYNNIQMNWNISNNNIKYYNFTSSTSLAWSNKIYHYYYFSEIIKNRNQQQKKNSKYSIKSNVKLNLLLNNFIFIQNIWLSNSCKQHVLHGNIAAGYGYQILNGPNHFLQIEYGPTIIYNISRYNKDSYKVLIYNSILYSYQLFNKNKFTQCLTLLGNHKYTNSNLKISINFPIHNNFVVKLSCGIVINEYNLKTKLKNQYTNSSISLVYHIS